MGVTDLKHRVQLSPPAFADGGVATLWTLSSSLSADEGFGCSKPHMIIKPINNIRSKLYLTKELALHLMLDYNNFS